MMKHFYLLLIVSILLVTQLQAQNYWLELKVDNSIKYYPIGQIQKIDFSEMDNKDIVLHFIDNTEKSFYLKDIKDIQFTEDTANKNYKIILAFKDTTFSTFDFDSVNKLEIVTHPASVDKEIAFVNISESYPNPFQNSTTIEFSLLVNCRLEIVVYDLYGNLIKNIDNTFYSRGKHSVYWDGKSDSGSDVTAGIYYCSIRSDKGAIINKMLKIR